MKGVKLWKYQILSKKLSTLYGTKSSLCGLKMVKINQRKGPYGSQFTIKIVMVVIKHALTDFQCLTASS